MAATIDKDLVTALKAAKGGKPMQFAFVTKGGGGKLLVAKKVAPQAAADLKKEVGGTLLRGRLVCEEGTYVFETAKEPPPTLMGQLKKTIKESAAMTLSVYARSKADAEDDEDEVAVAAARKRLDALTGPAKAALAAKGPDAAKIESLLALADRAVKSGDPEQVTKLVEQLEPLVAKAAPVPPAPPPPPSEKGKGKPEVPPAPPPPQEKKDAGAAALKRLNALAGPAKAALAAKGPDAVKIEMLLTLAARNLKNGDPEQAAKLLDQLEPLVAKTAEIPPAPPLPPQKGDKGDKGDKGKGKDAVVARLKTLRPEFDKALAQAREADADRAEELDGTFAQLYDEIKAGKFDAAAATLDTLDKLVKAAKGDSGKPPPAPPTPESSKEKGPSAEPSKEKPPKAPPPKGGAKGVSNVVLQQSRLAWDAARKKVASDIVKLQKAIVDAFQGESELAAATKAAQKLDGLLKLFDERLSDKLDQALNAAEPEVRQKHMRDAAGQLRRYRGMLDKNPLVKEIDGNPFAPVSVHKTLSSTLALLESKLKG